jgi:hypothetical protein
MRASLKATLTRQIQKPSRSGNRRRSHARGRPFVHPGACPGVRNKRIRHNWLMEENYLG